MKIKNSLLLVLLCLSATTAIFAQNAPDVPAAEQLKTKEDYDKYAKLLTPAADWLEQTDLNLFPDERVKVNSFVIAWVSGSPTVTVAIDAAIMDLVGQNTQLLGIYLARYSSHMVENQNASKLDANRAAIHSIINVYQKKIDIKKNRKMDKLIKMRENKETFDVYMEANFS